MTTAPGRLIQMLEDVVRAFVRSDIAHAIAGGMAVAAHGLPRGTKDIDFLIDYNDIDRAETALRALGFERAAEAAGDGFARFVRHPLPDLPEIAEWVDLLLARQELGRGLIRDAIRDPVSWQGMELVVVSPAGLVLMKLLACVDDPSRVQDRADIVGLLQIHADTIDVHWIQLNAGLLGEAYAHAYQQLAAQSRVRTQPSGPSHGL